MITKGKLQLIHSNEADNVLKLNTTIDMEVLEENVLFRFNFDFKEFTTKAPVIINEQDKSNTDMVPYGLQVIDLAEKGFSLVFILSNENELEGSMFVCAANFNVPLPKIGFINKLLYHFEF